MKQASKAPTTLMEAIRHFAKPGVALKYLADLRWPNGVFCPRCGEMEPMFLETRQIWKCRGKGCGKQFSVKVGTVMEDSAIPLDKWLAAIWMLANCRNGVSSYEVARTIGVTQKTAWFLLQRIRLAMESGRLDKMSGGPFEADETYVGGKLRNKSKSKRRELGKGSANFRGPSTAKAIIAGVLQRGGKVRARIIPDTFGETLRGMVRDHVSPGEKLFTDAAGGYKNLRGEYDHESVNHQMEEYVRGEVHTNGIENFWSLLKRCLSGTYVNVEPFHLHRYLEEQIFRFNNRAEKDSDRFAKTLGQITGKRLTYRALTGGMEPQTC